MSRGRIGIVVVMILSLVASAMLRVACVDWQAAESGYSGTTALGGVGGMNSFALALVLGGLRGPLVMFLWSSSESQKSDRNLEDFDTKVEWIRLLQPEFDTVHLFQIWNKAYNISVLMASPANKYLTIMQAMAYADSVLQEKPADINILQSIGGIYSNKLGGHPTRAEEKFYNRQLREESMTDANRKVAYPDDTHFHRLWQSTLLLDDNNRILPELLTPSRPRPADVKGDWNDGSRLQYLARFQPFPYGVPPAALAYNYAKRAQVALTVDGQKPLQVSGMVIDSRPNLELESWALQDTAEARSSEGRAFGIEVSENSDAGSDSALDSLPLSATPRDPRLVQLAIEEFNRAASLASEMSGELARHLQNPAYAQRYQIYASRLADADEYLAMNSADRDYLRLRLATGDEARQLRASAVAGYARALVVSERVVLTYYTEDELVVANFPPHTNRASVSGFSDQTVMQVFDRVMTMVSRQSRSEYDEDRAPYLRNIIHSAARLKSLQPEAFH